MKHAYSLAFLTCGLMVRLTASTAQTPAPPASQNYILHQAPRDAATALPNPATYSAVQTIINYFDGLARPTQTVQWRAGGNAVYDIVTQSITYDALGRVGTTCLPVPGNQAGEPRAFPIFNGQTFYGDAYIYTEPLYEASPLNRVTKQFGPGQAWRGTTERPQTMQYGTATATVYRFHITDSQINALVPGTTTTDSYNAKDLSLKSTTNEQGQATLDYTDLLGRLIRRDVVVSASETLTTVYVYDDLGRLAGVLPPKLTAYSQTTASFLDFTNAVFDELAFVYQYDTRGRLIRKHLPSAGWTDLVYDTSDRLVMSQDEQDRAETKWRFTRYDGLNRVVQTGRLPLNRLAPDLRDDFAGQIRQNYPTTVAPGVGDVLTQHYYDSYTDVGLSFNPTGAFASPFPDAANPAVRGLATGGQVRNLENGAWYRFGMWYDERGRIIQQQSQNHLGGTDRTDTRYRFNGEVLETTLRHERTVNGQPVVMTVATTTDYDHASRPLRLTHAIDGAAPTELAAYTYDAVGRLVEKTTGDNAGGGGPVSSRQSGVWNQPGTWQGGSLPTVGGEVSVNPNHTVNLPPTTRVGAGPLRIGGRLVFGPGSTLRLGSAGRVGPLQTVRYRYHIRGGLSGINTDGSGNPDLSGGNLFALKLGRDDAGQFGGNIGSQTWATARDGQSRAYQYSYDGADRLTGAGYSGKPGEDFSLSGLSYDQNGNLLSLARNGLKSNGSFGQVDNLAYTYSNTGNRLQAVSDQSGEPASFTDVAGSDDYSYYADGSLKSDANKGITLIEYNHLKLPRKITLTGNRWVSYEYDATGKKLKKTTSAGQVTDYVGPFEYLNGQLSQISHAEGRAIPDGLGGYEYEYRYEDHLGNLRALYRDSAGVAVLSQVDSFGPWGEPLGGLGYSRANKDRYGYGGHERQDDFGLGVYDFGARMYDPTVPRFWQIDPSGEKYTDISPYNYVANNPLLFTDPDGREIVLSYQEMNKKGKLVTRTLTYTPNMKVQGPQEVQQTIQGLNFIGSHGCNFVNEIAKADFFKLSITVDPSAQQSTALGLLNGDSELFKGNNGKYETQLSFGSSAGYIDENNNTHSPLSSLYHELEHVNLRYEEAKVFNNVSTSEQEKESSDWMKKRNIWSGSPTGIAGYMNKEEYYVTRKEAAYQKRFLGEEARPNHRGDPYNTMGVFSRKPLNGIAPKFKPRRQ